MAAIALLLEGGLDPLHKDHFGSTPVDWLNSYCLLTDDVKEAVQLKFHEGTFSNQPSAPAEQISKFAFFKYRFCWNVVNLIGGLWQKSQYKFFSENLIYFRYFRLPVCAWFENILLHNPSIRSEDSPIWRLEPTFSNSDPIGSQIPPIWCQGRRESVFSWLWDKELHFGK